MRAFSIALGRGNCYYLSYRRLVQLHAMAHCPCILRAVAKPTSPLAAAWRTVEPF